MLKLLLLPTTAYLSSWKLMIQPEAYNHQPRRSCKKIRKYFFFQGCNQISCSRFWAPGCFLPPNQSFSPCLQLPWQMILKGKYASGRGKVSSLATLECNGSIVLHNPLVALDGFAESTFTFFTSLTSRLAAKGPSGGGVSTIFYPIRFPAWLVVQNVFVCMVQQDNFLLIWFQSLFRSISEGF